MIIFRMKTKACTKRGFLSFPQFVQKKWKTKEISENTMVKTHEKVEADVEILLLQQRRTHVRKASSSFRSQLSKLLLKMR